MQSTREAVTDGFTNYLLEMHPELSSSERQEKVEILTEKVFSLIGEMNK